MKINTSYLVLKTDKNVTENSSKVRGYLGNKFKDYPLLHNHYDNEKFLYSYPLIQYQVFEGQISILGIEEGAKTLKEISSEIGELKLANSYYKVSGNVIYNKQYDIGHIPETQYNILSPWIGLNSKNYEAYLSNSDWRDKKDLLNRILIGNILSMCKGLGIIVNRKLHMKSHLDEERVKFKSVEMTGFTGSFRVNFNIPDFFGLGKGVSQGFGTVKKVDKKD
ncbi:MAG: CRISPR-associated endonuclease Cas6 [Methanobacteriaceae archaeon]